MRTRMVWNQARGNRAASLTDRRPRTLTSYHPLMLTAIFALTPTVLTPTVVLADTVLYADSVVAVDNTLSDPTDLWIDPADLQRVNGFELKPEGACIDDICVPVRQDADSDIFITRGGKPWFNVTELASRLQQPYVADHDAAVWSFGAIPARRSAFVDSGIAPDFALPDINGKLVRLSDFQRKKILLLTWASW